MIFPWNKYKEIGLERRNTLQVFITNRCNLKCNGCFARKVMVNNQDISLEEYQIVIKKFLKKGGKQINLLGGEPLLHPNLKEILDLNKKNKIKTTIYTNGYFINKYTKKYFKGIKLRISICSKDMQNKMFKNLKKTNIPFDANFMVSRKTTLKELLDCAYYVEKNYNCSVFFIFSMRELDNPQKEFFMDTVNTMPVMEYKQLVHNFLQKYRGKLEVHVSKRGVFESTVTIADNKCRFANYFIGGKVIQCPYDVINLKFQKDYSFGKRFCQQNNSCLMSKIKLERKN